MALAGSRGCAPPRLVPDMTGDVDRTSGRGPPHERVPAAPRILPPPGRHQPPPPRLRVQSAHPIPPRSDGQPPDPAAQTPCTRAASADARRQRQRLDEAVTTRRLVSTFSRTLCPLQSLALLPVCFESSGASGSPR